MIVSLCWCDRVVMSRCCFPEQFHRCSCVAASRRSFLVLLLLCRASMYCCFEDVHFHTCTVAATETIDNIDHVDNNFSCYRRTPTGPSQHSHSESSCPRIRCPYYAPKSWLSNGGHQTWSHVDISPTCSVRLEPIRCGPLGSRQLTSNYQ